MPALDLLERLHALDVSAANFPDQIAKLLCGKEYQECIQILQDEPLAWFVGILDNVCLCVGYPPCI